MTYADRLSRELDDTFRGEVVTHLWHNVECMMWYVETRRGKRYAYVSLDDLKKNSTFLNACTKEVQDFLFPQPKAIQASVTYGVNALRAQYAAQVLDAKPYREAAESAVYALFDERGSIKSLPAKANTQARSQDRTKIIKRMGFGGDRFKAYRSKCLPKPN
ncbi:hypothetical protein [Caulobacter phage DCM]|uniref:Uncharacterized protein n=1 Tax=Caulobacter phage DCM TaxID=3020391 RepID=A0AAF0B9T1_9CAUD|nr:hypothetical protein [Caulobacter phage DCM]WCD56113.1 hypothetical protein [Caulobacter phage BL199]